MDDFPCVAFFFLQMNVSWTLPFFASPVNKDDWLRPSSAQNRGDAFGSRAPPRRGRGGLNIPPTFFVFVILG